MLKILWIMRHGLAEAEYDSDFTRALSAKGELQAKDVASQLLADWHEQDFILPQQMLVSPFKRTQQTAKIMHQLLELKTPLQTEEMLVHTADAKLLASYLLASDFKHLMLVSHMPIVAYLCQQLLSSTTINAFQTAQIVKLKFDEQQTAQVEKIYLPR